MVSTIQCSVCGMKRCARSDPFYHLSIQLPQANPRCTLNECIHTFTEAEVLDGDNMVMCPGCQRQRKSTMQLTVSHFPRVLVIQLKRFDNHQNKIHTRIDFPTIGFDASGLATNSASQGPCHPTYDLFAVCHHIGTDMYQGHYTSTCLNASSNWSKFDDHVVTSSLPGNDPENVYILFYKQRE